MLGKRFINKLIDSFEQTIEATWSLPAKIRASFRCCYEQLRLTVLRGDSGIIGMLGSTPISKWGKMDLWRPEKWESFQGLSRWIRAAAAANTRGLLLTSWATHQGRADKWKAVPVFSGFQGAGVGFFSGWQQNEEKFFFFFSPALGDRRAHIRYLLYLADFRQ